MILGTRNSRDHCPQINDANIIMDSAISGIIAMDYYKQQFTTGYIDPISQQPGISPSQSAQIVSILSAGTFFGALGAAPFADHIGRRPSLILAVAVFTLGVILQTVSRAIPLFLAGRYTFFLERHYGQPAN